MRFYIDGKKMKLTCESSDQQHKILTLVGTLQKICKEVALILKNGDIQYTEGKAKKETLVTTYTVELVGLLSYPLISFGIMKKKIPTKISDIGSCEDSLHKLEEIKTAIKNATIVDRSLTSADSKIITSQIVNEKLKNLKAKLKIHQEITEENYPAIVKDIERNIIEICLIKETRISVLNTQLENVLRECATAEFPSRSIKFLSQLETIFITKINNDALRDEKTIIHQEMNKELLQLKTFLRIDDTELTPQNINQYAKRPYTYLGKNTLILVLDEIQCLLKKEMFQVDLDNSKYKDAYVNFVHQIKNIATKRLEETKNSEDNQDDKKEHLEEKNPEKEISDERKISDEEKNINEEEQSSKNTVNTIMDMEELNELLTSLKVLFSKKYIRITRTSRRSVFGTISTISYVDLQEIKKEIDKCLASPLMKKNKDHRSYKNLDELCKRIETKVGSIQYSTPKKPEEKNKTAEEVREEQEQRQLIRKRNQEKKEKADALFALGFKRRKESIGLYRECISVLIEKITSNNDLLNNTKIQINTSMIRQENEQLNKEVLIMYANIDKMQKQLDQMFSDHKQSK